MEHIIASKIHSHLESSGYIINNQHGFRKRRSCESQLFSTAQDFINTVASALRIDAIVLDFSKALDNVHHKMLLRKLR